MHESWTAHLEGLSEVFFFYVGVVGVEQQFDV